MLVRKERKEDLRDGGTMIYNKSNFVVHLTKDLNTDEIKTVRIEMSSSNKSRNPISSVYQPPNVDINQFKANMENVLDVISCERKKMIILADFNCDMSTKKLSSDIRKLDYI